MRTDNIINVVGNTFCAFTIDELGDVEIIAERITHFSIVERNRSGTIDLKPWYRIGQRSKLKFCLLNLYCGSFKWGKLEIGFCNKGDGI